MALISQSGWLQALGWAVLNSLWQMALLWIIFQVIIGFLKIQKPSQKSLLATTMLITGFSWFLFTFISIINNASQGILVSSGIAGIEGSDKLNTWLHSMLPVASILYLLLLILPVLHFVRNYRFVKTIRIQGLKKIDVQWRIFVKKVAAQMSIKKPVRIWISDLITSPVTVGYLKPVILVPLAAINHLTPQQLEAVLLHELSHIRRYDYLINLIINFIQTVLYFNPFVKSFVKTIEREREKSCDEMVVQFQYDPHGYASALLLLEKANHSSRALAVAASGKKNDLVQRIELILGINKKPAFSFNKLAGLFAGLLCIISVNALLIFTKPSDNKTQNHSFAFANLSSPFFSLTGDDVTEPKKVAAEEEKSITKDREKADTITEEKTAQEKAPVATYMYKNNGAVPYFVNVNYRPAVEVPQLKNYQEAQINDAINKSKKVIEEGQWKVLEKNIADAMTSSQKDQLKTEYLKEFNKMNMDQWKEKLRLAYNQIDWDRINDQLGKAVFEIRLDSLQTVYNEALSRLGELEQHLAETDQKGIPDTDITLKMLGQEKKLAEKALQDIKAVRNKKIIHL